MTQAHCPYLFCTFVSPSYALSKALVQGFLTQYYGPTAGIHFLPNGTCTCGTNYKAPLSLSS
eukprot:137980-Rhodomonas_salina.2